MTAAVHLALAERARNAPTPQALGFLICNATDALVAYRQAALLSFDPLGRARLHTHSGLASVEADAPYALWLADLANHLKPALAKAPAGTPLPVDPASLPPSLAEAWHHWLPAHLWAMGVTGPDGQLRAVLLLAREDAFPAQTDADSPAAWLGDTLRVYGHAWWALSARRQRLGDRVRSGWQTRRGWRWLLLLLPLLLAVPVREYAMAPSELVSLASQVIAAPQDGVLRAVLVPPNTPVAAGQILAELDDTTLNNRVLVSRAALASARADQLQASQRAFALQDNKGDAALAEGRVREREAELNALQAELARVKIRAPAAGVFVYSHPDEWTGKPVQTGERIGFLADPAKLGVQAWVPVGEAINLVPGAPMTLFLRVAPLAPVAARLDYASYQVGDSPDGVASYRVRGSLLEAAPSARIGLRGTTRIGGEWTVLGYLLLRRPIAAAREWCGC
jgi:biotin carboxyl carrier protein